MSDDGLSTLPNVFQRLMLQWERFAPYNAAQYMALTAALDSEHVAHAWRDTVITLGLQQIGQHPDLVPRVNVGTVESFISGELNRRFIGHESPLRPFVLLESDATHVGIVYRHVVADSASIRLVMREWFGRLLMRRSADVSLGHVGLMRGVRTISRLASLHAAVREPSRASRVKRVRRLPERESNPSNKVAWQRVDLPDGWIGRALSYAQRRRVKLNDLFVAAAAWACAIDLPHEHADARNDLGVGTIVDVRPATHPPSTDFGLSLGFIQTFWREHDLRDWDKILNVAAKQARIARERNDAGASLVRLAFATWSGNRLDNEELATFYRKRCPLAAGISNVNLNRDWPARHHPTPLHAYTRISPLGPMLPLVFTPTTLGTTCHVGVTYRTGLIDAVLADRLIANFVERLTSIE